MHFEQKTKTKSEPAGQKACILKHLSYWKNKRNTPCDQQMAGFSMVWKHCHTFRLFLSLWGPSLSVASIIINRTINTWTSERRHLGIYSSINAALFNLNLSSLINRILKGASCEDMDVKGLRRADLKKNKTQTTTNKWQTTKWANKLIRRALTWRVAQP